VHYEPHLGPIMDPIVGPIMGPIVGQYWHCGGPRIRQYWLQLGAIFSFLILVAFGPRSAYVWAHVGPTLGPCLAQLVPASRAAKKMVLGSALAAKVRECIWLKRFRADVFFFALRGAFVLSPFLLIANAVFVLFPIF
jgi:hypothetical protein